MSTNNYSTSIYDYYSKDFREFRKSALQSKDIQLLLNNLPEDVSNSLKQCFIDGIKKNGTSKFEIVNHYFLENSKNFPELKIYPGTYTMLDRAYNNNDINSLVDKYMYNSICGQSLRNRLNAVVEYLYKSIENINRKDIKIVDIGSGPGDYPIKLCLRHP